ncbi:hypothetical protein LCGC14_1206080 [marine sediment metagenome]|uniref:Uncharacterized protein n=1 Tax=marine sediment metagenome TaxID=412755 RepID=A0A0F9NXP6_9ZZZZ
MLCLTFKSRFMICLNSLLAWCLTAPAALIALTNSYENLHTCGDLGLTTVSGVKSEKRTLDAVEATNPSCALFLASKARLIFLSVKVTTLLSPILAPYNRREALLIRISYPGCLPSPHINTTCIVHARYIHREKDRRSLRGMSAKKSYRTTS